MKKALILILILNGCASVPQVDELMRDYTGAVPGASVLVLRNGRPVMRQSYGLADLEQNIAATPQTNYRLASVTKQFTAASILILADRGKLNLDDSIRSYLPSLPEYARSITIRHLLTHTSGLFDYEDLIAEDATEQVLDVDVLGLLEKEPRTYFAPGANFRYSNTGYAFLALIVEKVSGQSFATFLREEIFAPLGMDGSVAYERGISSVRNRAWGHTRDDGIWKRTDQSITSAVLGDGGIYSSIDDLAKWIAAVDEGKLLRPETWRLAFTPVIATGEKGAGYGMGWYIGEHRGHRAIWHTGETRGFRNALVRFPDDNLAVVILTNRNDPPPLPLALSLADAYLGTLGSRF